MQNLGRFLLLCLAVFVGLLSSKSARASDGVAEINQSCAVNTGCFAGDGAGYPITITTAGSYRLTSNLIQTSASASMIAVSAHSVSIDLNGFEMAGLATCTGEGRSVTCTGPAHAAIHAGSFDRLRVQNGRIRNVGGLNDPMIIAGDRAMIRNLVGSSGGAVVDVGKAAIVLNSTAYQTTRDGFRIEAGSLVMRCVSASNKFDGFNGTAGFSLDNGGTLLIENSAYDNGDDGIVTGPGSVVRGSSAYFNFENGIAAGAGTLVSENVAYENRDQGIYAIGALGDGGIAVQRNTVRLNGKFGLFTGPTHAAYRENTLNENTSGAIPNNADLDMGGNSCNGTTTCP